jgi:hypothetical protein
MQKTNNYDIFQKHLSNRITEEGKVVKIMKSIQSKNLLEYRPILVDEQMHIVDGQHRLEAAKRLNIDIYYTIQKGASSEDMYILNQNQNPWVMRDFHHYFVNEGFPEYIRLQKFMDKNELTLRNALVLIQGRNGGKDTKQFNLGKFKFPEDADYLEIMEKIQIINRISDFIRQKIIGTKNFLKNANYLIALSHFLNIREVNIPLFMEKLAMRLDLIRPCTKSKDYMLIFKTIYNFRNRAPISLNEEHENDPIDIQG